MKSRDRHRVIYNHIIIAAGQVILISWLNRAVAAGLIHEVTGLFAAGAALMAGGKIYYASIKNTLYGKEDAI